MMVESVHPGVEVAKVIEETGFELIIPSYVKKTPPPTESELKILRGEVNPLRLIIGR